MKNPLEDIEENHNSKTLLKERIKKVKNILMNQNEMPKIYQIFKYELGQENNETDVKKILQYVNTIIYENSKQFRNLSLLYSYDDYNEYNISNIKQNSFLYVVKQKVKFRQKYQEGNYVDYLKSNPLILIDVMNHLLLIPGIGFEFKMYNYEEQIDQFFVMKSEVKPYIMYNPFFIGSHTDQCKNLVRLNRKTYRSEKHSELPIENYFIKKNCLFDVGKEEHPNKSNSVIMVNEENKKLPYVNTQQQEHIIKNENEEKKEMEKLEFINIPNVVVIQKERKRRRSSNSAHSTQPYNNEGNSTNISDKINHLTNHNTTKRRNSYCGNGKEIEKELNCTNVHSNEENRNHVMTSNQEGNNGNEKKKDQKNDSFRNSKKEKKAFSYYDLISEYELYINNVKCYILFDIKNTFTNLNTMDKLKKNLQDLKKPDNVFKEIIDKKTFSTARDRSDFVKSLKKMIIPNFRLEKITKKRNHFIVAEIISKIQSSLIIKRLYDELNNKIQFEELITGVLQKYLKSLESIDSLNEDPSRKKDLSMKSFYLEMVYQYFYDKNLTVVDFKNLINAFNNREEQEKNQEFYLLFQNDLHYLEENKKKCDRIIEKVNSLKNLILESILKEKHTERCINRLLLNHEQSKYGYFYKVDYSNEKQIDTIEYEKRLENFSKDSVNFYNILDKRNLDKHAYHNIRNFNFRNTRKKRKSNEFNPPSKKMRKFKIIGSNELTTKSSLKNPTKINNGRNINVDVAYRKEPQQRNHDNVKTPITNETNKSSNNSNEVGSKSNINTNTNTNTSTQSKTETTNRSNTSSTTTNNNTEKESKDSLNNSTDNRWECYKFQTENEDKKEVSSPIEKMEKVPSKGNNNNDNEDEDEIRIHDKKINQKKQLNCKETEYKIENPKKMEPNDSNVSEFSNYFQHLQKRYKGPTGILQMNNYKKEISNESKLEQEMDIIRTHCEKKNLLIFDDKKEKINSQLFYNVFEKYPFSFFSKALKKYRSVFKNGEYIQHTIKEGNDIESSNDSERDSAGEYQETKLKWLTILKKDNQHRIILPPNRDRFRDGCHFANCRATEHTLKFFLSFLTLLSKNCIDEQLSMYLKRNIEFLNEELFSMKMNLDKRRILLEKRLDLFNFQENSEFSFYNPLKLNIQMMNLIGKGGFAEVWEVFDSQNLEMYAVKIHKIEPHKSNENNNKIIQRAENEINIHLHCHRHIFIVKLEFFFVLGSATNLIVGMELCDIDLDKYIKQHGPINEVLAISWIKQVLLGLLYMKTLKGGRVHHCDLKPANLLIKDGVMKISDFGLAKLILPNTTQYYHGGGTLFYQSPECLKHSKNLVITDKIDIWAVGCILYEMLFCERAFQFNYIDTYTKDSLVNKMKRGVKFPKTNQVSDITVEFIQTLLEFDHNERPSIEKALSNPIFQHFKIP